MLPVGAEGPTARGAAGRTAAGCTVPVQSTGKESLADDAMETSVDASLGRRQLWPGLILSMITEGIVADNWVAGNCGLT